MTPATPTATTAPTALFQALADDTRLRCLVLIALHGELCVCELVSALELSQPKISRHLKLLRDIGLVADRRDGTWVYYRLAPDRPDWVRHTLDVLVDAQALQAPFADDARRLARMADRPGGRALHQPKRDRVMNILYLCTGNSCRSQMAEGWTRHLAGAAIAVRSAGLEAHGLNPNAVATMADSGVDISTQSSNVLTDADLAWADLVVTVCGHADGHCPLLPPDTRKQHWPIDDPARATGSAAEIAVVFSATRDRIRAQVHALLDDLASNA